MSTEHKSFLFGENKENIVEIGHSISYRTSIEKWAKIEKFHEIGDTLLVEVRSDGEDETSIIVLGKVKDGRILFPWDRNIASLESRSLKPSD